MEYDDVLSILEAVDVAVEANDLDRLDDVLGRLNSAYDAIEPDERTRVARSHVAKAASGLTADQRENLTTYERWFITTHIGRASLLAAGEMYRLDPDETDPDELHAQIEELADRERGLRDSTGHVDDILDNVKLPPRIGILSLSTLTESPALGDEFHLELEFENVGNEVATDIEVSLISSDLDVEQSKTIDSIEPGNPQTLSFKLTAVAGGSIELYVSIESNNAGTATESKTITVRTKKSIVEASHERLQSLIGRIHDEAKGGSANSLTRKLDAVSKSLNRALSEIERGRNKEANNAITTSTNQLGAVLNTIENRSKRQQKRRTNISSSLRTAVENHTTITIEQLADARNTNISP